MHLLLATLAVLLEPVQRIDSAFCLSIARGERPPDAARCPGFIVEAFASALVTCGDAGGSLVPAETTTVWGADVDGDGEKELTFALDGNVSCEGAWSVFSCGSLGCPVGIYQEVGGAWRRIATIPEGSEASVEVIPRPEGRGYGTLRAGSEILEWQGEGYETAYLEVNGFRVDVRGVERGLRTLFSETVILATPTAGAPVLARYPAGTEVAVVGTTPDGAYLYVSPCNACQSGFVPRRP